MIDRIRKVKEYANLTTRAFALKMNLNQPSVDRMMKGVYAVNMNLVAAILEHFPEISAEWLMRGKGEMLLHKNEGSIMETINDRIQKLVDNNFGGNKAAFAKAIGMIPAAISNYLGNKRRSKPPIDMVVDIIKNLNVDAMWLLTGEGSMFAIERDGNCCGDGSHQVTGNQNNLCMIPEKFLIQEQEGNAELRRMLADAQSANARLIALLEKYSLK